MLDRELIESLPSPCYLVDEAAIKRNLELLAEVRAATGCKILLALKAFAMWRLAPLVSEYLDGTNAASLNEALLGLAEFKGEVHLSAPALGKADLERLCSALPRPERARRVRVIFNSLEQYKRLGRACLEQGLICGLRVNPERSVARMAKYDPCGPGSRFGVTAAELAAFPAKDLEGITGLHFHVLCEQNADALAAVLEAFEQKFGKRLAGMTWLNMGGGHHVTRLARLHPRMGISEDYDVERLEKLLLDFNKRHPLQVYLEPGEAVAWGAGVLAATVLDIIRRDPPIAVLDASAAAHMPDVLEAPYTPQVFGAVPVRSRGPGRKNGQVYRLAGNTCFAGDLMGDYAFDRPLQVGSRVLFMDQAHYTMVKNNAFNGLNLPCIALLKSNGELELVKEFGFEHFRSQLS